MSRRPAQDWPSLLADVNQVWVNYKLYNNKSSRVYRLGLATEKAWLEEAGAVGLVTAGRAGGSGGGGRPSGAGQRRARPKSLQEAAGSEGEETEDDEAEDSDGDYEDSDGEGGRKRGKHKAKRGRRSRG